MRLHADLSESEIEHMCDLANTRTFSRNDFLLREGEICRHKIFILSGLLKTFVTASDGNVYTLRFSSEGSWIMDKESYDQQIPARYNICAVEPSTVLLWHKTDFESMEATLTPCQPLSEILRTTPEERYKEFVNNYPVLQRRMPLRMIAAYLGISIRTLDRIRQEH